jgi:hypothetical protein
VNSSIQSLPGSIRKDGGRADVYIPPKPPAMGPRRNRMDAAKVASSVKRIAAEYHMDAGETALFLRSLLYIMPQPYMFKYPEIKYADLFSVNYSVPTGAKSHAFHEFDEMGNAQIMDSYADTAPNVEEIGYETIGQIYGIRAEYSYSIQDIRSAQYAGIPLDAMKAMTARRVIERKCDALAAVGDSRRNFTGVLNNPSSPAVTPGTKAAGGTTWAVATPTEILTDCNKLLTGVFTGAHGTITPNRLGFGTSNWALINTQRLDTFNMVTTGSYLLNAMPWVDELFYWPQLDTAGAAGKELVMATNSDPTNYQIIIPQDFEQFPPQAKNLSFLINCHKRFGGVQMRFPGSVATMLGTV